MTLDDVYVVGPYESAAEAEAAAQNGEAFASLLQAAVGGMRCSWCFFYPLACIGTIGNDAGPTDWWVAEIGGEYYVLWDAHFSVWVCCSPCEL